MDENFDFDKEKNKAKKKYSKLDDKEIIEQKEHLYQVIFINREEVGSQAKQGSMIAYVALTELLMERSEERRREKVFSKRQAAVIMWATVVIAFFTAYPTLKNWFSNIDEVGCLFEQRVTAIEAIHE